MSARHFKNYDCEFNGRVETGVVQFGDDWPGVFIRGDSAAGYFAAIEHVLVRFVADSPISRADAYAVEVCRALLALLNESKVVQP